MPCRPEPVSPTPCASCPVRGETEFRGMSEAALDLLDRTKRPARYLPGQVLFHEGDDSAGMFAVYDGLVGIRKVDAEGNSVLLRLIVPGETIGYRSTLLRAPHLTSAEVLQPSVLCFIPSATVHAMVERSPGLYARFLERAASDLRSTEEKVLRDATLSVRHRLAHFINTLSERYGYIADDGSVTVEIPVSRQDLAALMGVRPESMSRTIRGIEDEGAARFTGRRVEVPPEGGFLSSGPRVRGL